MRLQDEPIDAGTGKIGWQERCHRMEEEDFLADCSFCFLKCIIWIFTFLDL
jgi:hypothetical protein